MFVLNAEVAVEFISERTRERLSKARVSSKMLGRPKGRSGHRGSTDGRTRSGGCLTLVWRRAPWPRSPACPGLPCTTSSAPGVCGHLQNGDRPGHARQGELPHHAGHESRRRD